MGRHANGQSSHMTYTHPPLPDGYVPARPFWTRQQYECFLKSLPHARFNKWMEPRTGKSEPTVAKACYYYERKSHPLHIVGVLIIAFPNGVHRNWITESVPLAVPQRIRWMGVIWRSDKCRQVSFKRQLNDLYRFKGLRFLAVNVEALPGEDCRKAIGAFMQACGSVMVVMDESSCIAHGDALRAQIMANIGRARQYVRIMENLDGTPVDKNGPLDYWSQVGWMGHDILGYPNEKEFRKRFAVIETKGVSTFWARVAMIREEKVKRGIDRELAQEQAIAKAKGEKQGGRSVHKRGRDWWTELKTDRGTGMPVFRNMDEIWRKLDGISYRATFAECFPDAQQHIYQKRFFQLTPKQRKVYDDLQQQYIAHADEVEIKAEHPLTRKLRCQQVTSNYYPGGDMLELCERCDGNGCEACDWTGVYEKDIPLKIIDDATNPRIDALELELRYGKPCVVWCRFRQDVDFVLELALHLGISACRYDGAANQDQKADSREGFQAGRYDLIVGNELSLSRGVPLHRAEVMVGYSNMFSFRTRRQVEERASHGSKKTATAIVDLVAEQTVDDEDIIPALRSGMDVSTWVMRDAKRTWI